MLFWRRFMAANLPLQGRKILVTRPKAQSEQLVAAIEVAGGEALVMPVIDIKPLALDKADIDSFEQQDFLIFISRNAVTCLAENIDVAKLADKTLVAVGSGTAKAMQEKGLNVSLVPQGPSGSEGLLAMPELHQLSGKRILIVRGRGGRELLADTLMARGAIVQYIEVYERVCSSPTMTERAQALTAETLICTSVMGIDNLVSLFPSQVQTLFAKRLVVVSDRIKQHAVNLGFKSVFVTKNVSDDDIMHQLNDMEE
jgi:uroporphyrinogen-III synthase